MTEAWFASSPLTSLFLFFVLLFHFKRNLSMSHSSSMLEINLEEKECLSLLRMLQQDMFLILSLSLLRMSHLVFSSHLQCKIYILSYTRPGPLHIDRTRRSQLVHDVGIN